MPMTVIDTMQDKAAQCRAALSMTLTQTDFQWGKKYCGKVRDTYELNDKLILVTTDRQSAFDRQLASVPFKGQALNQTSAWWFQKTKAIFPNHIIGMPDPNVIIAKKCRVFPVEFVVRGYITGTTNTSLWQLYQQGLREISGLRLPDDLQKNTPLAKPILTPTTKDSVHDKPITATEIVAQGLMTQTEWDEVSKAALALYTVGANYANERGLILVDTKYEFGRDQAGNIVIVDEMHTQDSSRYWLAASYAERMARGQEPDNFDKEILRLWFSQHCDPYHDKILPEAPSELIVTLATRYVALYEMLTQQPFDFLQTKESIHERINRHLTTWLE